MSKQPDGKAVWLLVHAKISIVAVFPQLQIEELKLQITEANAELTQNTERAKKAGADAKQSECYSATLTQTIEQAETSLSEIKDFSQYLNAAEKCRDLLQRIFEVFTEHFNRSGMLRDKKAEQTLLEKIQADFKRFLDELRGGKNICSCRLGSFCRLPADAVRPPARRVRSRKRRVTGAHSRVKLFAAHRGAPALLSRKTL